MGAEMRVCKVCGLPKPYDPGAKQKSKASGFYGAKCWDCHLDAQREYRATPEGREATRAAGLKSKRRKVVDPATGEVITAGALSNRKQIASGWFNEYQRNRMATDPLYKLARDARSLIICSMQGRGFRKSSKTAQLLGCDFEFFQFYLEEQFSEGMTWENAGEWHLDHRIPCSAARNEEELIALQHYSNFQPLWGEENLSKSDALPDGWECELDRLVKQSQTVTHNQ